MPLIALAVASGLDLAKRQSIIRLAYTDPALSADRLVPHLNLQRHDCPINRSLEDLDTFVEALISVEMLGTGRPQRELESLLVRGAILMGLPPPDLSIGPAQIRISTATAAATDQLQEEIQPTAGIALQLLSACGARSWARLILKKAASEKNIVTQPLRRADIDLLAGHFNGQKTYSNTESAIANYMYRELVYQVYQAIKFHAPRE